MIIGQTMFSVRKGTEHRAEHAHQRKDGGVFIGIEFIVGF